MVAFSDAFTGFSVNDIAVAKSFYADTLGMTVSDGEMGMLHLVLPSGQRVLVYPKPDHEPASFTILNLVVEDVEGAVDDLNARGVVTKIYGDESGTDEKGIQRQWGPPIAWFRDPAGNVLSVIAGDATEQSGE